MANAADNAWVGRQIDTRYVIESELGGGGMGVVLRGRHRFTGAAVAIKMMRADLQIDAGLQERFLAEARAPAMIGHPGIVNVLDAGKMQSGELYLVMELLIGDPLRAYVGTHQLARADIRRIGIELLDALGAAHAKGFVHRDLKPENVFLEGPTRVVRLLDFGIAKTLAPDLASPKTAAGVVLGTLLYMSPEQLRDPRSVDGRSDLWSVGVILYELLSGALPYRGTTGAELYTALATKEPEPIARVLPGIGQEISAFFARALARDPRGRFATAAEMTAALQALALDGPSPASGVGATQWTLAGADPARAPAGAVIAATLPPTGAGQWPAPPSVATPSVVLPNVAAPVGPSVVIPLPPKVVPAGGAPPPSALPVIATTVVASARPPSSLRYVAYALFVIAAGTIIAGLAIGLRGNPVAELPPSKPPDVKHVGEGPVVVAVGSGVIGNPIPPTPTPPTAHPPTATPPTATPPTKPPPTATPPTKPPPPTTPLVTPPVTTPPVTPTTKPPTTPPATGPGPFHAACVAGCKLATSCALSPGASCVTTCEANGPGTDCVRGALDCNGVAACAYNFNCNGITPRGSASCNQTMICQDSCRGDAACQCACVQPMAPSHTYALLMLDSCAVPCASNHNCIVARCQAFINQCARQ